MKSPFNLKRPAKRPGDRGFALVVTLSLMILLTIIAVGLLSLSAVSLRTSSQAMAHAEAQANARLALMLALGDLQKTLGPDRAVTATSEILGTPTAAVAKPNTTGVWESWWDFDPNDSPDYAGEKTNRFRSWLVSSANVAAPRSRDFVTTAWTGKTIELVGNGSLGPSANAEAKVTAGLVPVARNGKVQGSYGWHVSDESVKARVNLYRDPEQNTTLAQKRALLAGHRPDPSVMKEPGGSSPLTSFPTDLTREAFDDATAISAKVTNLNQAELLDNAKGKIKPFRNDITPYSLGVLADVRGGGLKQDLSSMFEASSLPSDFNNKTLYQSTHGITGDSDPNWSALAGYYNSFRSLNNPDSNPTFTVKSSSSSGIAVPVDYNLTPVIAKVDTIFSLIGRPLEDVNWIVSNGNSDPRHAWKYHDYFVNLIFTPVVTLHNPYNVNISFNKMTVVFENIPVAFNFMHKAGEGGNFVSMSVEPNVFESINTMRWSNYRGDKNISMTIANWANADKGNQNVAGPIVLKPGQTLVCSPKFSDSASFFQDANNGSNSDAYDWENNVTNDIKGAPGYITGLGYEISGITISALRNSVLTSRGRGPLSPSTNHYPGAWAGQPYLMLRDTVKPVPDTYEGSPRVSGSTVTDEFYVEFKMQLPGWYASDSSTALTRAAASFAVTAEVETLNGGTMKCADFIFNYKDDATLKSVFGDRVFRYPPNSSLKGHEIAEKRGELYKSQGKARPFAVFSASARTTNGGVYDKTKVRSEIGVDGPPSAALIDGRLAGKPYLFHNPSGSIFTTDLATQKPGAQAYELNFQPFLSNGEHEDYMDVDITNRVPSLTGNTVNSGIKSGSYIEIPSGPLQTLADFRRSNALSTSFLPYFVQPVGNSLLHPLMSPDKVLETDASISPAPLLDHSVLANHALYDRFYFSTFATRGTETPDEVFEAFMNGTTPLASQAFQPHLPGGKTVAALKTELFTSGKPKEDTYKTAAEYQMIRGPFNVNSTNVQAWKAVLASMNQSEVAILWARNAELETKKATGVPVTGMSMLNGGSISSPGADGRIDNAKTNAWNGYRELDEPELEKLAVSIVEEVRDRGPFLSMSEFVNRQVGPVGPRTLKGALEAAIAKAEVNEEQNANSSNSFLGQVPIEERHVSDPTLYSYKTPEATIGNPAAGAPGWVNQGDLLRILEPGATVRGDTFVIRTYGQAQDASGNVTARAYAEAVVQRIPEYLDPADRPSLNAATSSAAKAANKTFGRRIDVVSFRWLSANEI